MYGSAYMRNIPQIAAKRGPKPQNRVLARPKAITMTKLKAPSARRLPA